MTSIHEACPSAHTEPVLAGLEPSPPPPRLLAFRHLWTAGGAWRLNRSPVQVPQDFRGQNGGAGGVTTCQSGLGQTEGYIPYLSLGKQPAAAMPVALPGHSPLATPSGGTTGRQEGDTGLSGQAWGMGVVGWGVGGSCCGGVEGGWVA